MPVRDRGGTHKSLGTESDSGEAEWPGSGVSVFSAAIATLCCSFRSGLAIAPQIGERSHFLSFSLLSPTTPTCNRPFRGASPHSLWSLNWRFFYGFQSGAANLALHRKAVVLVSAGDSTRVWFRNFFRGGDAGVLAWRGLHQEGTSGRTLKNGWLQLSIKPCI